MRHQILFVFDFDGTLVRTDHVTAPAVRRAFTSRNLIPPDDEETMAFTGKPVELYHAWLHGLCPKAIADEVVRDADRLELEILGERDCLYPGTLRVLDQLRRDGHILAGCTNGPLAYVDRVLATQGLAGRLDTHRCRGMGYPGKVEMLAEIMRLTASASPGIKTMMVGDRQDDVTAAHANGAFAIGSLYGFGSADELAGADVMLNNITELPETASRLLSSSVAVGMNRP